MAAKTVSTLSANARPPSRRSVARRMGVAVGAPASSWLAADRMRKPAGGSSIERLEACHCNRNSPAPMVMWNRPLSDDAASDTFARLLVNTSDGVPTKEAGDSAMTRQRVTINVSILWVSPVSLSTNSALLATSHGDRRAPVENHTSHGSDGSSSGKPGRSHSRSNANTLLRRAFLRLSCRARSGSGVSLRHPSVWNRRCQS